MSDRHDFCAFFWSWIIDKLCCWDWFVNGFSKNDKKNRVLAWVFNEKLTFFGVSNDFYLCETRAIDRLIFLIQWSFFGLPNKMWWSLTNFRVLTVWSIGSCEKDEKILVKQPENDFIASNLLVNKVFLTPNAILIDVLSTSTISKHGEVIIVKCNLDRSW